MSVRRMFFCICPVMVFASVMAADGDYRIAGILDTDDGHNMRAVIELPDGEQGIFRSGDPIGDGQVLEISWRGVRLVFPGGERLLPLQGDGSSLVDHSDNPGFLRREVSPETLQALASVRPAKEGKNRNSFSEVNAVLDLPVDARIISVQDQAVDSAKSAARQIQRSVQQGQIVRVALDGVPGTDSLYLFPADEPDAENQEVPGQP